MNASPPLMVRDARRDDIDLIIEFNARLASESEGKTLDAEVLAQGVARALGDPERLRYFMAEHPQAGRIVGQAAISREWSDWRNGWVWWFQSVYVRPENRRQGVFRALHRHIRELALTAPDVIGLRLYVEEANERAHQTYESLGLLPGGYFVCEEIWTEQLKRPRE